MTQFLRDLFLDTIRAPASAAARIAQMSFARSTLWNLLALACVLNALTFGVTNVLFPIPDDIPLAMFASPVIFLLILSTVTILSVFAFYWAGRAIGGQGAFSTILLMTAWLQLMRVAIQVAALVMMLFLPALADVFVFVASIYVIYVFVHFMNVAHSFNSLGRTFMMILITMMGLVLGLSTVLALLGVAALGPV